MIRFLLALIFTATAALAEPIRVHRLAAAREIPDRVRALLDMVGLQPEHAGPRLVERDPVFVVLLVPREVDLPSTLAHRQNDLGSPSCSATMFRTISFEIGPIRMMRVSRQKRSIS